MYNEIVFVLADIIENRDKGSVGHIRRTIKHLKTLTDEMLKRGIYAVELNKFNMEKFCLSACLHDIGKISVPENIICKPDKLTAEEFEIIKTHAIQGELIIDQIASETKNDDEFLCNAKFFAGYHHERWDGKGYPRGLNRINIPIQGRIMAIIDVYDALVSKRPYKEPFTHEEAVKIIMDSTGEMFDPLIAEAFFEVKEQFLL